jgi:IucA / IucC family
VHPWQWQSKLASIFAPDIATHKLILLGQCQDPAKNLKFAGTLKNPIAAFNQTRRSTSR